MEGKVINSFLPDLVTAVSDSVLSVSDQCLAKGLINETVYKRVLESGGTSEDKARTLILAVKKGTETDSRCFELFLSILNETLPSSSKGSLLLAMKNKLVEKSEDKSLVLTAGHGSLQVASIDAREIIKQQTTFFGKLEDAIRQHEHAIAEKILLKDRVKSKENENQELKSELNCLSNRVLDSAVNVTKIEDTESRITACEAEMSALKGRIEELESIIEEQGMQVKRGRNITSLGLMNMMGQLSFLAQKEVNEVKQVGVKKEAEYKVTLEGKEQELLKAKSEGEEKQQQSFEILQEKDAQLTSAQREKQKLEEEMKVKSLQHEIALKDKDLKIKELELEMATRSTPKPYYDSRLSDRFDIVESDGLNYTGSSLRFK